MDEDGQAAGFVIAGLVTAMIVATYVVQRSQLRHVGALDDSAAKLHRATLDVHSQVQRMADETGKAQRLALWVGAATAVTAALIGAFVGALASRLIGG